MANRYWVGGTSAWDGTAGTKWSTTSGGASGAAVPTTADDVFFDAASGASTVTISTGNTGAKSVTCTGFTGSFTGTAGLTVAGSFVLVATMGVSAGYTGTITITATGTLTTATRLGAASYNVNAPGSTVTLGGAFSANGTSNGGIGLTVTAGTFDTGTNYAVSPSRFDASGSGTKTLNFNASTITVGSSGADGLDNFSVGTNTTVNAGTSTISMAFGNFRATGYTFYNLTINAIGGIPYVQGILGGSNTFNQVRINAPSTSPNLSNVRFQSGATTTIGTMIASGATIIRRIYLVSSTLGTAATLSVTTWATFEYLDFEDIALNSNRSGTSIGNCGGCTNITFDAAKTVYWNLTGTALISDAGWATTSGGSPALANFPLAQDTMVFDNAGAATTVSTSINWRLGTVNLSARTSAMTLDPSTFRVYGNWVNSSNASVSVSGSSDVLDFVGSAAATLTSSGRSLNVPTRIRKTAASVTLQDAASFGYNGTAFFNLYLNSGTLNSNNYTVTISNANAPAFSSSTTDSRTLAVGTSTWSVSGIDSGGFGSWYVLAPGLTVTGSGTISMIRSSAKTFDGGGVNYGSIVLNQGNAGALTITGANTFGSITNTYGSTGATTITFPASTTTTVAAFTASGTSGKLLTINSSSVGTQATLSKASGTVSVSFLSVKDSAATGGATWNTTSSIDGGNNTGWNGLISIKSNFFLLFF
jgi:hypothetical protein